MLPGYHNATTWAVRSKGFTCRRLDNPAVVDQTNNPPATPKDATQATDEQREEQDLLDRRNQDPDAPGRHQTHHDIPDVN